MCEEENSTVFASLFESEDLFFRCFSLQELKRMYFMIPAEVSSPSRRSKQSRTRPGRRLTSCSTTSPAFRPVRSWLLSSVRCGWAWKKSRTTTSPCVNNCSSTPVGGGARAGSSCRTACTTPPSTRRCSGSTRRG